MRKHTITIYSNDEFSFDNILQAISFDVTKNVFDRENIRKRKFNGKIEECIDEDWSNSKWVARWESNVVSESEFRRFQNE